MTERNEPSARLLREPGKGRPRRPRRPAAQTRQDILATAEQLFQSRGYQAVTIADIAEALGMSPANVFKHFQSKTHLVDRIATTHVEQMMAQLTEMELTCSPQAKLLQVAERLLSMLLDDIRNNPHIFEIIVLTSDLDLAAATLYRQAVIGIIQEIVIEGMQQGVFFVRDAAHTASVVATALEGVINPLTIAREPPPVLYGRCRDLIALVNTALQNPLAK